MRIGIDISSVIYETGVSWYTRNLVHALLEVDKKDDFILFAGSLRRLNDIYYLSKSLPGRFARKFYPLAPTVLDILWNRLHILPVEWLVGQVDVFHSSDWTQPPAKAYKVTTIHDLAPLRFPEISHPKIVAAHKVRLKWVKKEVNKIIAVSKFTKQEIVELLDIDPGKIVVIHEAPDPDMKPTRREKVEEIKKRLGIETDYLLTVGTDPRKNIPVTIQAFTKLRKNMPGLKLVIVGRLWEEKPTVDGVVTPGHVGRQDLAALYSGAQALVYASLYEGFGLPILEAMQVGCPVITSNVSSMPEVAADAAVLVDPKDPGAIAKGIEKVLSDRKGWIEKGKKRASQFSWKKTAKETVKVYYREHA